MKKTCLVLTLILSSFFIFNLDVKADEVSYNVDFDFLSDDFLLYKQSVDEFISNDLSLGKNYIIYFEDNKTLPSNPKKVYRVLFCEIDDIQVIYWKDNVYLQPLVSITAKTFTNYVLNSSSYTVSNTIALLERKNSILYNVLYSTFNINTRNDGQIVNLVSDDYIMTFNFNGNDSYPTFYDMYLEKNGDLVLQDPHKDEKEALESFYTICISKLCYLAEEIVSNYIYLSMLVILILVFVFLLVFRRLL